MSLLPPDSYQVKSMNNLSKPKGGHCIEDICLRKRKSCELEQERFLQQNACTECPINDRPRSQRPIMQHANRATEKGLSRTRICFNKSRCKKSEKWVRRRWGERRKMSLLVLAVRVLLHDEARRPPSTKSYIKRLGRWEATALQMLTDIGQHFLSLSE